MIDSGNQFDIVLKLIDQLTPAMAQVQSQLKTAMANMAGSTKPVSDAMDRLLKSLSGDKLIQDAKNIVAAVQQIGGATKLTEAEAAKYNATLTQAMAKLKALGQEAPADMQALASATKQAGGVLNDLSSHVAATAAGFLTAQAIIDGASTIWHTFTGVIEESITAWAVQESATTKMTAALRQHGLATPAVIAQYVALSSQLQRTTTYADELTQGAAALLTEIGDVMPSKMAGALKASTDLAAGLGIDLDSATRLVAKAAAGHTETLGRYGIVVSDAALKTQGFDAVLEAINRQFGGQAAAAMDTYAGRVAVLKNAWGDVLEELGKAIVMNPQVESGIRGVTKALQEWVDQRDRMSKLRDSFDGTSESFDTLAKKIGDGTNSLDNYEKSGQQAMVFVKELNSELEKMADRALRMPDPWANLKDQQIKSPAPPFTGSTAGFQGAIADQLQIPDTTRLQLFIQSMQPQLSQLTTIQQQAAAAAFAQGQSVEQATHSLEAYWPEIEKSKSALEALKKTYDQSKDEAKKFDEAMVDLNAVGEGWAGTLDTIDGNVAEAIKFYLAAGVEQGKLAVAYALTGAQVKAVDSAMKDHVEALKTADGIAKLFTTEGDKHFKEWFASVAKSLDETNKKVVSTFEGFLKAQKDYHEAVAKDTLDADDFQRFQLEQQLQDAKAKLAELGESYRTTYDLITKTVEIKLSEIGALWKESEHQMIAPKASFDAKLQVDALALSLHGITGVISEIGQLGGDQWAQIAKGANDVAKSVENISKAMASLQTAGGFNVQNLASLAAGWIGIFVAMWQVTDAIYKAQDAAKTLMEEFEVSNQAALDFSNTLRDNMGTSALGSGLLTDLQQFSEALDRQFKTSLDAVNRIYQNEPRDDRGAGGINLQRAEALNLMAVIKELGGASNLTAHQLDTVAASVGLLFGMVKDGGALGQEALKSLNDAFGELATTDKYGRFSDFFMSMVESARAAGVEVAKLDEIMKGQADNAAKGLSDLLQQPLIAQTTAIGKAVSDAQDAIDKLKESGNASADAMRKAQGQLTDALTAQHSAAERSKQAIDDIGAIALVTFNSAIASGQDFVTALESISPALSTIQKAYADLGLAIDDTTLKGLTLENTILNGTAEAPSGLGTAIKGLAAGITAATNLGPAVETPAAAAAQQRALAGLYAQAQGASAAAGTTGDAGTAAALLPFQQTLHQLQDWAKKNGQELDSHTSEMITQSQQLGIWNDDFKSDSEKTRESIADLIKSNEALAAKIGAVVPAPGASSPGGAPPSGFLPGDDPTGGLIHPPIPIQMASGGFGFASGPMVFSTKGNEEYAFSGEGQRFSRNEAPDSGAAPAFVYAPNMTFQISSVKPDTLAKLVEDEVMPLAISLIEDHVRDFQPRLSAALARRRT